MFLMGLWVLMSHSGLSPHWVRLHRLDLQLHLDLLLHWVRPLLTALRYLMGQQFLLDLIYHWDRMFRLGLSPRSVPPLLKDQHFRWVRGRHLVRGPLMALLFLESLMFHSAQLGQ